MASDKTTIGMTPNNRSVMELVAKKNVFKNQMDAAKFAMALSINMGVMPAVEYGSVDTTWNIGSFDPNGELRDLIPVLFPGTEAPYRAVESLVNLGLEIIGKHIAEKGDLSLIDLMK